MKHSPFCVATNPKGQFCCGHTVNKGDIYFRVQTRCNRGKAKGRAVCAAD